jgi:hypothetical protein
MMVNICVGIKWDDSTEHHDFTLKDMQDFVSNRYMGKAIQGAARRRTGQTVHRVRLAERIRGRQLLCIVIIIHHSYMHSSILGLPSSSATALAAAPAGFIGNHHPPVLSALFFSKNY